MKFFTDNVVNFEERNTEQREIFNEACRLNHIEYNKVKKRLPKQFVDIYEKTAHFDDAIIPNISIVTEGSSFTYRERGDSPSKTRIIIVDYDDYNIAWEILIGSIKEMSSQWTTSFPFYRIDCFSFDELLIEDKDHISWEIAFSGGLNLRMVFKEISIRELNEEEINIYRQPMKKAKFSKLRKR